MEQKDLELKLSTLEASINEFVKKAEAEIKNAGSVSAETKAALEAEAKKTTDVLNRLLAVEQKMVSGIDNSDHQVKTIGELFIESDNFKTLSKGAPRSGKVVVGDFWKTALVNATGQNQPLVQAYRKPGIVMPAMQPLRLRDVIPSIPIGSNLIEYVDTSMLQRASSPSMP